MPAPLKMYQVARASEPLCAHEFPSRRFLKLYKEAKSPADHDCPACAVALTNPARVIAQCIVGATVMRIGMEADEIFDRLIKRKKAEKFDRLLDILPLDDILHIIDHLDNPADVAKLLRLDKSITAEYFRHNEYFDKIIFKKGILYAFPRAHDEMSLYARAAAILKEQKDDADLAWEEIKKILDVYYVDPAHVRVFARMMRYLNIDKSSPLYELAINEFENVITVYDSSWIETIVQHDIGEYETIIHENALYATIKNPHLIKKDSINEFVGVQMLRTEIDIAEMAILSDNHDLAKFLISYRNDQAQLIFSDANHYEAVIELYEVHPDKYADLMMQLSDNLSEAPEKDIRQLSFIYFWLSRAYINTANSWILTYMMNISPYDYDHNRESGQPWTTSLLKTITHYVPDYIKSKPDHVKNMNRMRRATECMDVLIRIYRVILTKK